MLKVVITLFFFMFSLNSYALDDSAAEPLPEEEQEEVEDEIEEESRLKIIPSHFRFRVTLDVINGINFVASAGVEDVDDQFVAFHRFKMIGELPDSFPSIRAGKEVIFARVFDKKKDAAKSLKTIPLPRDEDGRIKAPVSADAFLGLEPGSFVSLPVVMSLRVGQSVIDSLSPDAGVSVGFFLDSTFSVNIMRLEDSKVRLRLIAQNKRGVFADASIQLVSDTIGDLFDTEIIARGSRQVGDILAADYTFDLASPEAKEAFNAILFPRFKFKDRHNEDLERWNVNIKLISDLTKAEEVVRSGSGTVVKNVRASARYKLSSAVIGLDAGVFGKFRSRSRNMSQNITIFDREDNRKHYLHHSYDYYKKLSFGGGAFKVREQTQKSNYVIFETNEDGVPLDRGFIESGSLLLEVDRKMRKREAKGLKEYIRWNITESMQDEIFSVNQWSEVYGREKYKKLVARADHKFDDSLFAQVAEQSLSYDDLQSRFESYLETRGLDWETLYEHMDLKPDVSDEVNRQPGEDSNLPAALRRRTEGFLNAILSLQSLERGSMVEAERELLAQEFKAFNKNPLNRRFGYGFMMHLAGDTTDLNGWYSRVSLKSERFPETIKFERGQLDRSEEVAQIRLAQEILHDTRWVRIATDLDD